jgi:hypothetical protein
MEDVLKRLLGRWLPESGDGAVHALDLTTGPRVFDLGQPVLDVVLTATHVEHVRHVRGLSGHQRIEAGR